MIRLAPRQRQEANVPAAPDEGAAGCRAGAQPCGHPLRVIAPRMLPRAGASQAANVIAAANVGADFRS